MVITGEPLSFGDRIKSAVLKCGNRTFFFDVNLASNQKKYLKITQSSFIEKTQERKRNSLVIFPEEVQNFKSRLNEVIVYLG